MTTIKPATVNDNEYCRVVDVELFATSNSEGGSEV